MIYGSSHGLVSDRAFEHADLVAHTAELGRDAQWAKRVDARLVAGIALITPDNLAQTTPRWQGCWQARQGLGCGGAAQRSVSKDFRGHNYPMDGVIFMLC